MRTLISRAVYLIIVLASSCEGADDIAPARKVAIARGLEFLVRDAQAWKAEHQCVSCHHAGLVRWALDEARQRRFEIDEPVLASLTAWIAGSGPGTTGLPRPAEAPRALNTKALWFALALGSTRSPEQPERDAMAGFVKTISGDQLENGSWSAWPGSRAPMFGSSDASMTALAALALIPAAAQDAERAKPALERAVNWMRSTPPDAELESLAIRLVVWKRTGQPEDEVAGLARRLRSAQRADGGWSQVPGVASDAWATGQALYALADLAGGEDALIRGQRFLIGAQHPDGSWPMDSRPTRAGGDPAGLMVPITGAGSAFAVLGLVRCQPLE